MDAFKQKFGEQNPEEREKRKKQLIGINFFQLALCLAMVIIGVQYNDLEDCRSGEAPKYLLLGGGIVLATTAMKLIAYLTPCKWDDKIVDILTPIADFAGLVVTIWGSVVVFGKFLAQKLNRIEFQRSQFLGAYSTWEYVDKESHNYCAYTPYMFAFVLLIIQWCILPFIFCCTCCFCCFGVLYGLISSSDEPSPRGDA